MSVPDGIAGLAPILIRKIMLGEAIHKCKSGSVNYLHL